MYKSPVNFGTMERVFCCISFTGNPDGRFPLEAVIVAVGAVVVEGFCPELDEAEFDPKKF